MITENIDLAISEAIRQIKESNFPSPSMIILPSRHALKLNLITAKKYRNLLRKTTIFSKIKNVSYEKVGKQF